MALSGVRNMMKRFVVLQDESLIFSELQRPRDRGRPLAPPVPEERAPEAGADDHVDLPTVARAAAQQAERKAIDEALARFRWNRGKAATYLGVSYKTLLNKMKECGITDPEAL
jgi:DNA-binding NtrC family response regulator